MQEVQISIRELLEGLEVWSSHALGGARTSSGSQRYSEVEREHLLLMMHYWSTKILITRPCLCRTERRIRNESDASAAFNVQMAEICVLSARELVSLFPDEPDLDFVYGKAPWWSVIHMCKFQQEFKDLPNTDREVQSCNVLLFYSSKWVIKLATSKTTTRPSLLMFRS